MFKIIASIGLCLLLSGANTPDTLNSGAKRAMDMPEIYDAAVFGKFSRVEDLLKQDPASVNATDNYGFTPLHGVVGEHYFDMARLLIAKGANVNAQNDSGTTPLHSAAYPEMVEILVTNGAAVEARDSEGSTPLFAATEHPELIDVMEQLLELGANVNALNNSGRTPLDIAKSREDVDKVELLKLYGGHGGNAAANGS
jgi:uncharacterized protein